VRIVGKSMLPTLRPGALYRVCPAARYSRGDLLIFQQGWPRNEIFPPW
jgi:phage repressor protein C with HTH and peptisase S24 domain